MVSDSDSWNPEQYNKFRHQRMLPFHDLVAMIAPQPGMRILDLGCGTGDLTAMLADHFPDSTVVGLDSSAAMLQEAGPRSHDRLTFRHQDITTVDDWAAYDLIFSHAALQWVPDNEALMRSVLTGMKPGAQLAVQLPQNDQHASHALAAAVAQTEPFRTWLAGFVRQTGALSLERYATLLYEHGFGEATCLEKIYGHELPSGADVVEWVKGTLLTAYLTRLTPEQQAPFLVAYRERLNQAIGDPRPYFYPFRRLLFRARKGP